MLFFLFLLLADPAPAPAPSPAIVPLVPQQDSQQTGERKTPFVFTSSTIPCLTIDKTPVTWHLKDAPPSSIAKENLLLFSLADPGEYVVYATFEGGTSLVWIVIPPSTGPPLPDTLATRVKAALPPGPDRIIFRSTLTALTSELDASRVPDVKTLYTKLEAGLSANKWPTNKYPKLTDLFGELFGVAKPGSDLVDQPAVSNTLKTVIKALE